MSANFLIRISNRNKLLNRQQKFQPFIQKILINCRKLGEIYCICYDIGFTIANDLINFR